MPTWPASKRAPWPRSRSPSVHVTAAPDLDARAAASSLAGQRVLVTGATGAIAGPVLTLLASAGADVHALVRRPSAALPPPITTHVGDITDPSAVRAAVDGAHAVVHLAALLHVVDPTPALEAEYTRVNDVATAGLMQAACAAGVGRVVHASTIAVYGATGAGAAPLDEDAPCRPATAYARSKLAAEAHVLGATDAAGQPIGVVLRLAAVYGAGIKGNYRRLLDALARRRYLPVGDGGNRRTLVHEVDVARAVVQALTHPRAAGRCYNVTDGHCHEVRAIVAAMCAALGRRAPRLRAPVPVVRGGVALLAALATVAGRRPPVSPASLETLLEDVAIDGGRFMAELGYRPAFGLEAGWRDVVARIRAAGPVAAPVE